MNKFFLGVMCLCSLWCSAQSFIGFDTDNYSGIHGVLVNPASMADSRLRADINLVSLSVFGASEYAEIDYKKWIKSAYRDDVDLDEDTDVEYIGTDRKNSGLAHIDVLGPSAMISISEKHSAAFFTRVRGFANLNDVNGLFQPVFEEGLANRTEPILFADENSYGTVSSWVEFGASYARVLKNEKQNFIKAGVTLKYIRPTHFASLEFTDGLLFFDPNDSSANELFGTLNLKASNTLDPEDNGVRVGGGSTDIKLPSERGFGFDLGFVYEFRPQFRKNISRDDVIKQVKFRHVNTYKLRLGVSILDIGSVTYKSATSETYDLGNLPNDLNKFDEDADPSIREVLPTDVELKMSLPTNLRLDVDWAISDKFYLNAATRLSLISRKKREAVRYANQFTLNPRLETRWLSVFSPISVTQYSGVQWGLGIRVGPVFFGSGNLLGSIVDRRTRAFDVYAGIKIPLLHKIPKVKEEDEETIYNSECPFGCPQDKKGNVVRLEGRIKGVKKKKKRVQRMQGYQGKVK